MTPPGPVRGPLGEPPGAPGKSPVAKRTQSTGSGRGRRRAGRGRATCDHLRLPLRMCPWAAAHRTTDWTFSFSCWRCADCSGKTSDTGWGAGAAQRTPVPRSTHAGGPWHTSGGPQTGRGHTDLQGVGLGKADLGPPLDARPQVVDLGGDVAEGQVADHHLLLDLSGLDAAGLAAIPSRPCDLRTRGGPEVYTPPWRRSRLQGPVGLGSVSGGPLECLPPLGISAGNPHGQPPPHRPDSVLGALWTTDCPTHPCSLSQARRGRPDPPLPPGAAYIVLTEHHALGAAGGAGCVDQRAALVGLLGAEDSVQVLLRHLAPQLHELLHLCGGRGRGPGQRAAPCSPPTPPRRPPRPGLCRTVYTRATFSTGVSPYITTAFRWGRFSQICVTETGGSTENRKSPPGTSPSLGAVCGRGLCGDGHWAPQSASGPAGPGLWLLSRRKAVGERGRRGGEDSPGRIVRPHSEAERERRETQRRWITGSGGGAERGSR